MLVFLVLLCVFCKIADALCEQANLHWHGASVVLKLLQLADQHMLAPLIAACCIIMLLHTQNKQNFSAYTSWVEERRMSATDNVCTWS